MKKRTILVTGASGYFGKYFVEHLQQGNQVIAMGRDRKKLEKIFDNGRVIFSVVDLYDIKGLEIELEKLCNEYDITGLVNNAYDLSEKTGFNTPKGRLEDLSVEAMRSALESGLLAPMLTTQIIGKQMIRKGIKGSIVNISSMYGIVAPDHHLYEGKTVFNPLTYGVTKAGLNGVTRYVASFWGEHGIRCNSISPGPFPNVETVSSNAPKDNEFIKRLEKKTTLNRVGHPRDLLGILDLLLSDDSSYITGQNFAVDGGWTSI